MVAHKLEPPSRGWEKELYTKSIYAPCPNSRNEQNGNRRHSRSFWLCSVHSLCADWTVSSLFQSVVKAFGTAQLSTCIGLQRTGEEPCTLLAFVSTASKLPLTEISTPLCHLKRPESGLRQAALLLDHNCLKRAPLYLISLCPSHATTNTTTKQKITALKHASSSSYSREDYICAVPLFSQNLLPLNSWVISQCLKTTHLPGVWAPLYW